MMVTASFDEDQSQSRSPTTIWEEEDVTSEFVEDDFDDGDDQSKISSVLDLVWTEFVNDRSSATGSRSRSSRKSSKSKTCHRHRNEQRRPASYYPCDDDQSRSWWRRDASINKHQDDHPKSIAIKYKNRRNKTTIRL